MARGIRPIRYVPGHVPEPPEHGFLANLMDFLRREFRNVQIGQQNATYLDILIEPPARFGNGMIVYADGVQWNPGSGEGFYGYEAGAWVKL